MTNDCTPTKHPLLRNGLSRGNRFLEALSTEFFQLDERSTEDLLSYIYKYAKHLHFYNENHQKDGDWAHFLEIDDSSLLAIIGLLPDDYDLTDFSSKLPEWTSALKNSPAFQKELQQLSNAGPITKTAFYQIREKAKALFPTALQRSNHNLDIALLLTFLSLFRFAQEHLNSLTQKHLDFYYAELLRMYPKDYEPDHAHLRFKLARNNEEYLLKAGTKFKAGKDSSGKPLSYELARDFVVNHGKVAHIATQYIDTTDKDRIYYEQPELEDAFALPVPTVFRQPDEATIGFVIASPLLYLKEGKRVITATLNLDSFPSNSLVARYNVSLTTAEEWIEIDKTLVEYDLSITIGTNNLIVTITLFDDVPPIELLTTESYEFPAIKIELKAPENPYVYGYNALKDKKLTSIDLQVECENIKDLILENDNAKFKPGKSFMPFGPRPWIGSNFYIGSSEVFQKSLDELTITIEWEGLPNDFETYYVGYDNAPKNDTFKVQSFALSNSRWQSPTSKDLFDTLSLPWYLPAPYIQTFALPFTANLLFLGTLPQNTSNQSYPSSLPSGTNLNSHSTIQFTGMTDYKLLKNPIPQKELNREHSTGFMRLQLGGSDFRHDDYPILYSKYISAILDVTQTTTGNPPNTTTTSTLNTSNDPASINPPYNPIIRSVGIDYKASQTINFSESSENEFNRKTYQFVHLQPQGEEEIHPFLSIESYLLPQFQVGGQQIEGALLIGIADIKENQVLAILFQMLEGSGIPDATAPEIKWHILNQNRWQLLEEDQIISDSTLQLQQSGIIEFKLPMTISVDNTILPKDFVWFKAAWSATDNTIPATSAIPKLLSIQAQAAVASFVNANNDLSHLETMLPAETISKLAITDSKIREIAQPFPSFGGKPQESKRSYYQRVSERLRHKGKAIALWDYEHLIIEAFQEVYQVKCVNHYNLKHVNAAGHVTIALLPQLQRSILANPWEPKVNVKTRTKVLAFLQQRVTHFIACSLHVVNPIYEQVKVHAKVKFKKGYDNLGYYKKQLNEDIKHHLAPWTNQSVNTVTFGGELIPSSILYFIETLPYVDYLTDFKLTHYFDNTFEVIAHNQQIETKTPISVLTTYQSTDPDILDHDLQLIEVFENESIICPEITC